MIEGYSNLCKGPKDFSNSGDASGNPFCEAKGKDGATSISRGFGLGQKLPQSFGESLFLCFVSFGRVKEMRKNNGEPLQAMSK